MQDVIDIADLSEQDIETIYERAAAIKATPSAYGDALDNRSLLMLFAKPSTRTRVSFEAGMTRLGGHAINFSTDQSQLSRDESMADTAAVLSRYTDAIMARLYDHETMRELARHATVPVINGLTDRLHPCQALADIFTMREYGVSDGPIAYVGDGNNVAHSLMQVCDLLGVPCRVATPPNHAPDSDIVERIADGPVTVTTDPEAAVDGAKVVYTDVFVSMGDDASKVNDFEGYQVNQALLAHGDDPKFMHCLPAHRGEEVSAEVIDGPNSIVYDQAENRKHVQNAILYELLA
ncbi:MAG: ornithine carbamoyltransferase [Halanaeroarchaeum sp.]